MADLAIGRLAMGAGRHRNTQPYCILVTINPHLHDLLHQSASGTFVLQRLAAWILIAGSAFSRRRRLIGFARERLAKFIGGGNPLLQGRDKLAALARQLHQSVDFRDVRRMDVVDARAAFFQTFDHVVAFRLAMHH